MSLVTSLAMPSLLFAQSSSTNFEINEFFVGPGGDLDLNSANFNARATVGDLATGNFNGTNYQLYGGFTTTDVPYLELTVNSSLIDMGVLDSLTTGTGVGTFSVRTYLASGYSVHVAGGVPAIGGGATIDAIAVPTASTPGTEQFGLNLAANTSPVVFGASPVQQFNGQGSATNEYDDDGLFKYNESDAVASSNSSSGQTDYTASFIMNVSDFTDTGLYETSITFVATSTF